MRFKYTEEMIAWAKKNVPGQRRSESLKQFNNEFGLDKGSKAFCAFLKNNHIRCGMPPGWMPGEREKKYTDEVLEWLKQQYSQRPISEFIDEFNDKFGMAVNQKALFSACKRYGIQSGRDGRFNKGQESWNKGKKMPFNANSAKTQFKKGQSPHNTNYLHHERLSKDGYIEISVDQTNPHTGYKRRYVLKHRWLWEKKNGPVPEGKCLKCLDGDRANCDPDNWLLIDRGMLPALSRKRKFDHLSQEVKPTVLAITQLEHDVRYKRDSIEGD